jgi:F0F1-type ATP synthase beta subunit
MLQPNIVSKEHYSTISSSIFKNTKNYKKSLQFCIDELSEEDRLTVGKDARKTHKDTDNSLVTVA